MPLSSQTSLVLGRGSIARLMQRNRRSRFPIQWPNRQSFDGSGVQVDIPVGTPSGVATRNLGDNTMWILEGFSSLVIQLLVNDVSRGVIPNTPDAPLNGGTINQGDTVLIRKLAAPAGSGIFTVSGFDASAHIIAFGKFEAS